MRYVKFLLPLLAVLLVSGCGSLRRSSEERQAEEARVAALVQQRLDARQYRIIIDYMLPRRGSGKTITDYYSLTVDGSKIDSHLPYFGVAYRVPYGGGKSLVFEDDIEEYTEDFSRKGRRTIVLSTDNDEDFIIYTLTIFDGGEADIHVRCRNREDISYRGRLDPDAYPKE